MVDKHIAYWENNTGVRFAFSVEGLQIGYVQLSNNDYSVIVSSAGLFSWKMLGQYIQEALPELSATDREFLMTGFSPKQQDEMYKGLE